MSKKKLSANSGKRSLLLTLLTLLIAVGICAVATYSYIEIKKLNSQIANMKGPNETAVHEENIVPVYEDLEAFTVSLKPDSHGDDRVLYIGLTLRLQDDKSKAILVENLPDVRSRLLVLFSQQSAEDLISDDAKKKLSEKIMAVVSEPLSGKKRVMVKSVLFNAFILR